MWQRGSKEPIIKQTASQRHINNIARLKSESHADNLIFGGIECDCAPRLLGRFVTANPTAWENVTAESNMSLL